MNETREEIGRLISSSLGSREGEVDARAAEAVGNLDEGEGLEKLREVLSRPDQIKPWYKRWWMLGLCCVLLFIGVWFVQSVTYNTKATSLLTSNKLLNLFEKMSLKRSTYPFSDEERWLLSGESFHPIKELSPHNIVKGSSSMKQHAADYVHQYKRLKNVFPQDLLEIGETIDPDNPWYLYMRASDLAAETVVLRGKMERDRKSEGKHRKKRRLVKAGGVDEPAFVIDQAYRDKVEEAWELLEKADAMGILKYHRIDLAKKRLTILSNIGEHDYLSRLTYISEAASFSYDGMNYLDVAQLFKEKFEELSEGSKREEVEKWLGIHKRYLNLILNDSSTILDILVVKANFKSNLEVIQEAAEAVGLDNEAAKMKRLSEQLAEDKLKRSSILAGRESNHQEYGILGQLIGSPQVSLKPLNFDQNDHVPDRYSDHSFVTKFIALVATVLLFSILIFAASYLLYRGKLARFLGNRILSMLSSRDWAVVILGGVIAPIIFYYVINQHTPLGVRKWNILAADGMLILVQFQSMFLLMITASYCLLRWRLSGKSCGLVSRTDWWAWSALASSLAAMLLIGCSGYEVSWMAFTAVGFLVYPVSFLLLRGIRGLISNERLISVAAVNRGMIILLMLSTICTSLLVPFYYADEKKWIRADTLHTLNPEHLELDNRSYRTMQAMKQELDERLEMIR